ncbi:MAG: amino acid ABC transporter permease [Chloroflexota bacterium]
MTVDTKIDPTKILPPDPPGPMKWLRDNLFSSWFNSLMTLILIPTVLWILYSALYWAFVTADWTPITSNPMLFIVGQYPRVELWRVAISLAGIMLMLGISWGKWGGIVQSIAITGAVIFAVVTFLPVDHPDLNIVLFNAFSYEITVRIFSGFLSLFVLAGYFMGNAKRITPGIIVAAWLLLPIFIVIFLSGFGDNELMPSISTTLWGGILVTFLLAFGGILISFPIGVMLALGRRSNLPVVTAFSTTIIETIRGMPLVTILFMFSTILTLLIPPDLIIDRLMRALMAVTLFSAAYTAENVRGGLAAVDSGQVEAAKAVGMNNWKIMTFIVLPQAIRAILPAIVGQFIALFKDTTLVVIVGINDFLGIGRSVIKQSPEFLQLQLEVYLFIGAVYMLFSYVMSAASRRIESSLGVQHG